METLRHLVFDIGRVLIRYEPHRGLMASIPDADDRAWFLDTVCTEAWNLEQDRGRPWAEAEATLIAEWPDQASRIRAFRANWSLMVHDRIAPTVALYEQLIDEGRDVTLLTNFSSDTFVEAQRMFPFLRRARGVTVSGEIGLIKPDPAIFAHHQRSFGLDPSATFFIDDNAANVEASRKAGWRAVQYLDHDRLVRELRDAGVV
ncbi:2-haloalkanoic acid dehalogenase [Brevundimonas sp. LM2]|uniref:HAD family hydrolase n=1 Tax=Brevundimonas sp. LM2 TaxID=1938605 RepID=UPI00098399E2|nr:HAD family phosphatase [Brevundimonas sp. LM2]AQR61213.1 2-haloalkanoic acid dehalogenase [Brevundimonas sp. LM2]